MRPSVWPMALLAVLVLAGCDRLTAPPSERLASPRVTLTTPPSELPASPLIIVPAPLSSSDTSAAATQFRRYDTDKDGFLSQTEFVEGRWGEIRFIRAPTDAEVASMKAGFAQEFKQLDTNHDGKLSFAEFAASERFAP